MKNKCQYIEVCRFIGAIIILCHHSYTLMERTFFFGWLGFCRVLFYVNRILHNRAFLEKF